jgi:mannose-1-phosphate guanylyltransferase
MAAAFHSSSVWSVILAGGDGQRLQPCIQRWLGSSIPKQYCTFVGTRSMLQHTWDRADKIVLPRRKITVVGHTHQRALAQSVTKPPSGTLVVQPRNCDTAPGIFLPLSYVMAWDPQSAVILFPSDHFISPEDQFVAIVQRAVRAVEFLSDRIILLAVRPSHLELDYGWVPVGMNLGWSGGTCIHGIQSFVEKPKAADGIRLMSEGALWNTLVLVAKAETLWRTGWVHLPDMMTQFEQLRRSIGTSSEQLTLDTIYRNMPSYNFSGHVLPHLTGQLGVIELNDILWSDWGRPERIMETLQFLGKTPAFPIEAFGEAAASPLF